VIEQNMRYLDDVIADKHVQIARDTRQFLLLGFNIKAAST